MNAKGDFLILPVIAPSGAGKTRLLNQWLCKKVSTKIWDAGFLKDTDAKPWIDWKPERNTLIVIDYVFKFRAAIHAIVESAEKPVSAKVRLILADHIFPDDLEDLPRQSVLSVIAPDGSVLDERRHFFYREGPLWLARVENREDIIADIVTSVSGYPHNHILCSGALARLEKMGDAAQHPLFAALIGFAIKDPEFDLGSVPNRRQLIKYYIDKKSRLPWQDESVRLGKWIGAFVAIATAYDGARFDTLASFLPRGTARSQSALKPLREHCNRIVSSTDRSTLHPFQPDMLGETFFLMFLAEFSKDSYGEFWTTFLTMVEKIKPDELRHAIPPLVGFLGRLIRNLSNDDSRDPYITDFWHALLGFVAPVSFKFSYDFRALMHLNLADIITAYSGVSGHRFR